MVQQICWICSLHSCLEIKTSINKPSQKSVVLESSAKPSHGCKPASQGLVWQKIQEPLTQDQTVPRAGEIVFIVL